MKNTKIIYILISVFCLFAVAAGVYAQFFVNDAKKSEIIIPNLNSENNENTVTELSQEELSTQFSSLLTNQFDSNEYDETNLQKLDTEKEIVYNAISIEDKKENYEIKIDIPVINLSGEVAEGFNNITQSVFVNKASEILNGASLKTIYTVSYAAYINGDILSVIIESNLKEGNNPQRIIVQTYNYNIATGEKVAASDILAQKNIIQSDCQNKINETIKKAQENAQTLVQSGYTVYNRDLNNAIYQIQNLSTYFLGPNEDLYIIFAYGNQNFTSEMDIVWYE